MTYELQCDPTALQRITHIFSTSPLPEKEFDFGGETRFVLSCMARLLLLFTGIPRCDSAFDLWVIIEAV